MLGALCEPRNAAEDVCVYHPARSIHNAAIDSLRRRAAADRDRRRSNGTRFHCRSGSISSLSFSSPAVRTKKESFQAEESARRVSICLLFRFRFIHSLSDCSHSSGRVCCASTTRVLCFSEQNCSARSMMDDDKTKTVSKQPFPHALSRSAALLSLFGAQFHLARGV